MTGETLPLNAADAVLENSFREMTVISMPARSVLTFRTEDGRKLVFTVRGEHARLLHVGDRGRLCWTQEGAFHHFLRADGLNLTPLFAELPEEE